MKNNISDKIKKLEEQMASADFWNDKNKAQATIKELQNLKDEAEGVGKYDRGDAAMTIFAGAGGDDAEDFAAILFSMYEKFITKKRWGYTVLHQNQNDHGGFRNITIEINGKNIYGTLKNESGVHRLVRISPFNAKKLRHTSFALVEVIPKFSAKDGPASGGEIEIPENELRIDFARASGPGGQNVNKRETAVRVVHIPTKLAAHVDSQRSQAQNKEKALALLRGKLFKALEEERIKKEENMYISKTTEIEWGNQIRSYVMHPYKMVKDHRTGVETSNVGSVFDGEIQLFIDASRTMPAP